MTPDRKLIQAWRLRDPKGYRQSRAVLRIVAPIILVLLIAAAFMQALIFYDYARFDDPSHRVPDLIISELIFVGLMAATVRLWVLISAKD